MSRGYSGSCRTALPVVARRPAPARAVGSLSALVAREANVLAYIDGFWLTFWLAIAALGFVTLMTRAPPGPFTPAPFGVARALWRRLRWTRA